MQVVEASAKVGIFQKLSVGAREHVPPMLTTVALQGVAPSTPVLTRDIWCMSMTVLTRYMSCMWMSVCGMCG